MISIKLFCFVAVYLKGVVSLTCFSCKGITHPRFCDYVETCGDGEYCSFIKYSKTSGGTTYNLGCASNTTCTKRRSFEHEECHTCCTHDVCNDAGCGEQGHGRNNGPLCYKCSGVTSMTECDTITTCPSDELCITESNNRNGETYFNSGCQTKYACYVISGPSHIFGKRGINNTQAAHSKRCCAEDLCNSQYGIDLKTTTLVTLPKKTTVARPTCEDHSNCGYLVSQLGVCDDQHGKDMCPISCGRCVPTTAISSQCIDTSTECDYLNRTFNICQDPDTVKKSGCKKTCDFCDLCIRKNPCRNNGICQANAEWFTCKCLFGYSGSLCENKQTDSAGKEFYMIFLDNSDSQAEVRLYMVSRQTGICNIYIPYLPTNKSVAVSNTSTSSYIINRNIRMKNIGIENKSVFIKCDVDVSIFGMNYAQRNSDGYVALPFNRMGKRHVVPTFVVHNGPANVGVVAPLDNTVITVLLKTEGGSVTYGGNKYSSGESFSVTLLKYQTFYISNTHDLSGTIISSSKPVAVVAGVQMSVMNGECCNHMTEMILPARQLGKDFIVPVLYNSQCNVRMLSDRSSEISIHGSKIQNKTLQAGEFLELTNYATTTVHSNHGILVQIYCYTTSQTSTFDSIMVTLPSIQHYKSEYQFVVVSDFPDDQPPDHFFITIMIRSDAVDGLRLDGKSKIQYVYTSNYISMLAQSYLVLIHEIQTGRHIIEQVNDVPFGLIVNGKTSREGYGYPAGFRLNP